MIARYEAELSAAEPESTEAADTLPNVSYAVQWMIYYALFAIPVYIVCGDLQRGWVISANRYLPMLYIAVCAAIVTARLRHNGLFLWTPITWFFVMSALTFGMGPLIYYFGNESSIRFMDLFSLMDDRMLLRTNLLNTVGTLMVCLGHFVVHTTSWRPTGKRVPHEDRLEFARRMFWRILIVALPLKWGVFIPMYMDMFDFIIPASVQTIANLLGICISLAFYIWLSGERKFAWLAIFLFVADAATSLLIFSKFYLISPIIHATIGIFMARPKLRVLLIGAVAVIAGYMWVKPLTDIGRGEFYHKQKSLSSRITLIYDYIAGNLEPSSYETLSNSEHWWTRQSFASTEAHLIDAYDSGHPGNTINDFWVAFIPRAVWPDKPDISAAGRNLNYALFGNDTTSIGATVYGEAYWNGGWLVVALASIFIGIVFSVLGKLSLYYMQAMDLRFLPVAVIGIYYGLAIQEWFVLTFVGGIPLFFGIWYFIKFLSPKRFAT